MLCICQWCDTICSKYFPYKCKKGKVWNIASMGDTLMASETQVVTTNELLTDPSEVQDQKREIRDDVFTTVEEAEKRAEEIGCSGTHITNDNGTRLYMPCSSHDTYLEMTSNEESGYGHGKDKRKKPKKKSDDDLQDPTEIQTPAELKAYMVEDEEDQKKYGRFEGYGSIFGNVDLGNDVIEAGAFTKSLRKRPADKVKLLYQHKSDMPIGVFDEIKEDENGLYVKGRLALQTQAGKEAYELLKMGALDGLSIGFKTTPKNVSYENRGQRRIIKEVDLMEVSLVTFPMNPQATVQVVKGQDITIREWEKGMRDAFNLSRSEAKMCAKALDECFEQRDAVSNNSDLVEAIKNLTLTIKHR